MRTRGAATYPPSTATITRRMIRLKGRTDVRKGLYVYLFCDMRFQGERNYRKVEIRIPKNQLVMLVMKAINAR